MKKSGEPHHVRLEAGLVGVQRRGGEVVPGVVQAVNVVRGG